MRTMLFRVVVLAAFYMPTTAIDNGLGRLPPMGWRSWNAYHQGVTQEKMEAVMVKMAERKRTVNGKPTSFADLGYVNCGLDDYWQQCGAGVNNSFHTAEGSPLINQKFPDMGKMTKHGHDLGLRVGWYMNNCGCSEHQFVGDDHIRTHMEGSVRAVTDYGFDGIKFDGCGQFLNLTWWAELLNKTGRPVMIENCHWGRTTPGHTNAQDDGLGMDDTNGVGLGGPSQTDAPCSGTTMPSDCPYNFYRTSDDIKGNFKHVWDNLQSTKPYLGYPPLSRPGSWAYPDMMVVGKLANAMEDRAHFGAWCIVSSPLILGHDLTDDSINDRIWPIVSNTEAIGVSQTWAGHPGRLAKAVGEVQVWTKPLSTTAHAVLLLNRNGPNATFTLNLTSDLNISGKVTVRDIWEQKNIGTTIHEFTTDAFGPHDSRFYRFSAV